MQEREKRSRRKLPATARAAWRIPSLSAEEELRIARQMRVVEQQIRQMLADEPECRDFLASGKRLINRGRAGTEDCVAEAVEALLAAAGQEGGRKPLARRAGRAWEQVIDLRWELAISGARIAAFEARRRSSQWAVEDDLVQEGFIGLMQAAMRFDPEREIRFSTYARWWVRAQLTRAIDSVGRSVRLPSGAVDQLRLLRNAIEAYENDGEEWSVADIAVEAGVDTERATLLLQVQGGAVSIDDLEQRYAYHLVTADQVPPDVALATQQRHALLYGAIERLLTDKQRFVLQRRFGLDGEDSWTLARVGKELRVTKERVRQIERKALKRLKLKGGLRPRELPPALRRLARAG